MTAMTRIDIISALETVRAQMPRPFDPEREVTLADACQVLGVSKPTTARRALEAAGWTGRQAKVGMRTMWVFAPPE